MIAPKFSLDFTTGIPDPSLDVTRAGVATRVNDVGRIESVAADTQRIDYSTGSAKLLVEESRTNIILQSAFASGWTFNAAGSFGATTRQAPDLSTAQVLSDNLTTASGQVFQLVPFVSGTVYTFSFYIKAVGRTLGLVQSFTQIGSFTFDLSGSGSVGTPSGVFTNATITPSVDGWFRITANLTATATGSGNLGFSTNSSAYTGNAFALWGAQLEVGATVSSYIPTEASAVTRNADDILIDSTVFNSFWQPNKGGVSVQAQPRTVVGTRPLVQFDDGTADNIIALRGVNADPFLYVRDAGVDQVNIDAGTIAVNTDYSMTAWWATNDCKARLNSGAVVTDTTATIPTVTQMRIGSDGTNYLNGHLASISYYDAFSGQIYTRRKNKVIFSVI